MILIPTKKQTELLYEILSTYWLYEKLSDSNAFGDRMDEVDELIELLREMKDVNSDD